MQPRSFQHRPTCQLVTQHREQFEPWRPDRLISREQWVRRLDRDQCTPWPERRGALIGNTCAPRDLKPILDLTSQRTCDARLADDDVRELGHWRTHDGQEVDLVAETLDSTVVGFEIKAGREVDTKSLRGLIALRDSLGDQFRVGYLLNTGSEAYQIVDRIQVCPIDRLWLTNGT